MRGAEAVKGVRLDLSGLISGLSHGFHGQYFFFFFNSYVGILSPPRDNQFLSNQSVYQIIQ